MGVAVAEAVLESQGVGVEEGAQGLMTTGAGEGEEEEEGEALGEEEVLACPAP